MLFLVSGSYHTVEGEEHWVGVYVAITYDVAILSYQLNCYFKVVVL